VTDHRYRYRLPDGQVFESVGLARIKRQHPNAFIEGRIEFNERGEGTLVRYQGEQPTEHEPEEQAPEASGEQTPEDAPAVEDQAPEAPADDAEPPAEDGLATTSRRRRTKAS
jgi:hypothetical protein